jgi:hypothetical protein
MQNLYETLAAIMAAKEFYRVKTGVVYYPSPAYQAQTSQQGCEAIEALVAAILWPRQGYEEAAIIYTVYSLCAGGIYSLESRLQKIEESL